MGRFGFIKGSVGRERLGLVGSEAELDRGKRSWLRNSRFPGSLADMPRFL